MNSATTCPAETYDHLARSQTRCIEPIEHEGQHTDGCMGWCDEPVPGEVCPRCGHLEPITLDVYLVIEASQGDDGRWCASVTELPGVKAHGATKAEAVANVQRLALRTLADRVVVREPPSRAAPPSPAPHAVLRHTPFAGLLRLR